MTRVRQVKTTFTAGEVSRNLLGRADLRAYENGALKLRNVFIEPTGGVTRRAGLRFIDNIAGRGRLIAFEFNTEQTFLLVLTAGLLSIYAKGALVESLAAPWTAEQIDGITWTQSADTMLFAHADLPPKRLTRNPGLVWLLEDWSFFTDANVVHQPYFKFASAEATITPTGTSGEITLTSSEDIFAQGHEGTRLRIAGKEVEVTDFDSPTVVTANVIETLSGTDPVIDWEEQAFSSVRGYPVSVAFHQDRLVIGGSCDLPNRLWFSKSGDLFNFDLGAGLDDEAIEFGILSDQVNAIRGIFSGRDLQVFTSGAEWIVTGDPLTPTSVQIKRQTRVGSVIERYIPSVNVDGATIFVARNKQELREFIFTDLEQAYSATELSVVSRHIVSQPVDQDYDQKRRLLFIVREDGRFATLTSFRAEKVAAWTFHETDGQVKSVAAVGDDVYLLISRGGSYMIEQFDESLHLDSALTGALDTPALTWSGLDHLEGQSVSIVADGVVLNNQIVEGGQVVIEKAALSVQIGLPYTHIIEPLPPSVVNGGGTGRATRLVEAIFRIEDTASMRLDVGRGLKDVPLRQTAGPIVLDAPPPLVSKDVKVRALGWQSDGSKPLWMIEQSVPLPFTLLSVTTELKVND